MDETLPSRGPENMREDEHRIAAGYRKGWALAVTSCIPMAIVAYFSDVRWVLVVGVLTLVGAIYTVEGRLYDLCIRLRRTNILLRDGLKL